MRRWLAVLTLVVSITGGILMPAGAVAAQQWDPCGDYGATGTVPGGYTLVIGGNGGGGDQFIAGDDGANTLTGGPGNDILCGFDGDDTLVGGTGNDFIDGGGGGDVLRGNSGNDTLANGETNRPGSGNDAIIAIEPPPPPPSPCEQAALDLGYDPAAFNIVAGTDGNDIFTGRETSGPDLYCDFGGQNYLYLFEAGDVYIGGSGNDVIDAMYGGTFIGGAGNDYVSSMYNGTFDGGAGQDGVTNLNAGVFMGGPDDDAVWDVDGGTFNGGPGNDKVQDMADGTFIGGDGYDTVVSLFGGIVDGSVEEQPI